MRPISLSKCLKCQQERPKKLLRPLNGTSGKPGVCFICAPARGRSSEEWVVIADEMIAAHEKRLLEQAARALIPKRPPGRPPLPPKEGPKRPVGRPRTRPIVEGPKRPVGRPRIHPIVEGLKRPPGRPRIHPIVEGPKRPPGRPRIHPPKEGPKRPVGRPPNWTETFHVSVTPESIKAERELDRAIRQGGAGALRCSCCGDFGPEVAADSEGNGWCRLCSRSVFVCGRCVLHASPLYFPALAVNAPPDPSEILPPLLVTQSSEEGLDLQEDL